MSIEHADVEKAANLARLAIAESSVADTANRINKVLNLVDQLQAVDTDDIDPMAHPLDAVQALRADTVSETNCRDQFQKIAPTTEAGLYLVPRVID